MKKIAIIPAKSNSVRIPNKNIKKFCGVPMIVHTINHCIKSKIFDEIIVSTDSKRIAKVAEKAGANVPFLRPKKLTYDNSKLLDVCKHALKKVNKKNDIEYFCIVWATSPLRKPKDLRNSFSYLHKGYDGVFSATEYSFSPFCALTKSPDGRWKPILKKYMWKSANELPEVITDNGSFAWVRLSSFNKENVWMPKKSYPYFIPRIRSVDINTIDDWKIAEMIYKSSNKNYK
tara:strand:+ start:403 stop:1095 length:693 start_codon:yes stop_codon:yes gene_type:complete